MEVYEYFEAIKKHLKIFLTIIVLMTGLTALLTSLQPDKYEGAVSLTVLKRNILNQDRINFYLYDNYYAMQSSGLLADTIENWIHSPSIVGDVYQKAGIGLPATSLKDYTKIFQSKRPSAYTNVLNITTQSNQKDDADKLLQAMTEVIQTQNQQIAKDDPQRNYDIFASTPVVVVKKPAILLNTAIAFILSLILALMTVTFLRYLSKRK